MPGTSSPAIDGVDWIASLLPCLFCQRVSTLPTSAQLTEMSQSSSMPSIRPSASAS
jgi:hypothetical protein